MEKTIVHFTKDLEKFRSCQQVQEVKQRGFDYESDFLPEMGNAVEVFLPPKPTPEGPWENMPCQSKWYWEIVPESGYALGERGHYVCEHLIDVD